MHSAERSFELLGRPEDDTENTFTARMLLLLESRPVVGETAYRRIVERVIERYWRDAEEHHADYQPILLLNDIVRYWRTLLLNYEAGIRRREGAESREPGWEADRRHRSYKVAFSRCLTCYSALAYLLALTQGRDAAHVRRRDVGEMIRLSPLERLLWVAHRAAKVERVPEIVEGLLGGYLQFLQIASRGKAAMLEAFRREDFSKARSREKRLFGEAMFDLMTRLGQESPLMRWLVV
jgi:hypothetical protein